LADPPCQYPKPVTHVPGLYRQAAAPTAVIEALWERRPRRDSFLILSTPAQVARCNQLRARIAADSHSDRM